MSDDGEEAVLVGHVDTKPPEEELKEGLELRQQKGSDTSGSQILNRQFSTLVIDDF